MKSVLTKLYRGETNLDFIGRRRLWFAISAVVIGACLLILPFRPTESSCSPPLPGFLAGLRCGIEFKGGVAVQAPISESSELNELSELEVIREIEDTLATIGVSDAQIQVATTGDERSVIVQTSAVGEAEEQEEIAQAVREVTGATVAESPTQRIGRKWGGEITGKAIRALFVFLLVVSAFMSLRFEWKMAVTALIAMVHDLILTAGVYAAVGFEVTPSTVIAILTILGYSLYDNVVVFDKVEENTVAYAGTGKMTYESAANLAVNQVFMRSLNTSLTTLLPISALLFVGAGLLGATTMKDLALALLVGMVTGAYSSVFVAVPILSILKEREPRYQGIRQRVEKAERAAARPAAAASGDGAVEELREEVASVPARPSSTQAESSVAARQRVGSKKRRRRRR
jgi:preprotein translocase subunit SecF